MKKILFISLSVIAITVGALAMAQSNKSNDAEKRLPCRMIMTNCPTGYCCGYVCREGIPTLPSCIPSECGTVTPCQPIGEQ